MEWRDLPGWFDWPAFYDRMAERLPSGGVAVEVGVYMGRSLAYLAAQLKRSGKPFTLYAVDAWDDAYKSIEPEFTKMVQLASRFGGDRYAAFLDCMRQCGFQDDVRPVCRTSWEAAGQFA